MIKTVERLQEASDKLNIEYNMFIPLEKINEFIKNTHENLHCKINIFES
ncbi:MAG: hypothetical protein J6S85_09845 [Methanobrevibacter sp.]|nr:hypothetical protein [Methanobrevibacter sp.]